MVSFEAAEVDPAIAPENIERDVDLSALLEKLSTPDAAALVPQRSVVSGQLAQTVAPPAVTAHPQRPIPVPRPSAPAPARAKAIEAVRANASEPVRALSTAPVQAMPTEPVRARSMESDRDRSMAPVRTRPIEPVRAVPTAPARAVPTAPVRAVPIEARPQPAWIDAEVVEADVVESPKPAAALVPAVIPRSAPANEVPPGSFQQVIMLPGGNGTQVQASVNVSVAVAVQVAASVTTAAPVAKTRLAPPKPVQDEWGFFDPDQCGFRALLARLDAIAEVEEAD
jgi:hypothetical protein